MSIQGALNQAAGVGAALYTQTPGYAIKKEEKLKQTKIKGLESELAGYREKLKGLDMEQPGAEATEESLEAGEDHIKRELIKLDPSVSRLLSYYEELEIKRQEANYRAQGKKANKQEQKQTMVTNADKWGEINGK